MVRVQYLAMVAAAALVTSADGLQVVPNSAKSKSLRVPAEARYQPYVEGKTDRFLISEAKNDVATKPPTGYVFSTLQNDDNDMLQEDDDDNYDDESESSSSDGSSSEERAWRRKRRKRRRRKKKKHKETETPTPTPTLEPNATGTPAPIRRTPEPDRWDDNFLGWIFRRIND